MSKPYASNGLFVQKTHYIKGSFPVDLENPVLLRDLPLPLYPHVNMVGAPVRRGQPKDGTQLGPDLIRKSDIAESLKTIGVTLEDYGDIDVEKKPITDDPTTYRMIYPRNFVDTTCRIADTVERILNTEDDDPSPIIQRSLNTNPLVVIGGDHSLATGSIMGHRRVHPDACVIWIDAHADLNTPLTSSSGNMHGMPVSFLMEELQEELPYMKEFDPIQPCLRAMDIAYIGLRDLDPHEVYDLRKNGITHFTMTDVDKLGIEQVIHRVIKAVNPRLNRPIHISFDIDAMDPSIAPSTGTRVPGGLTLREGLRICEEIYATGKLSVLDIVEINPLIGTKDDVETTKATAISLMKACLGHRRSGHLPFKVHSLADEGIISRADVRKEASRRIGPVDF